MKNLGFLSENCLPLLSISCVNFQEQDGRKLWSFTFLRNPSCWRKLTSSPPPSSQSSSWARAIGNLILFTSLDLQHPSLPPLSRITLVSLSAACCCSPEWHELLRAAQGQSPPATKLPVSAAEQTVGPVNFTLQLLGEVFQLLICITWSCCPRNVIFQIQAKKKKKENCFCKNFVLLAIPFPPPPITEKA